MWNARLIKSRWLYRKVMISNGNKDHVITYDAWKNRSRAITVDHQTLHNKKLFWFTQSFSFTIDQSIGCVETRVNPWLTFKMLRISIDGDLVYFEKSVVVQKFKHCKPFRRMLLNNFKSSYRKILLGSMFASIFGSLFIGLPCWILSGKFEAKYYLMGFSVGILYFIFMLATCFSSKWPQLSEIQFVQHRENKPSKFDKVAYKYWYLIFVPIDLGFIYLILSTDKRMMGYFGYWVGMLFQLGIVILCHYLFYIRIHNTRRLEESEEKDDNGKA